MVVVIAAIPEPVTQAEGVPSIAARASARYLLVGFQCLEYRKHPGASPWKVSSIVSAFIKVKVDESVMEGFTSPNSPNWSRSCILLAGSFAFIFFLAEG
jgi:hypothetical protein